MIVFNSAVGDYEGMEVAELHQWQDAIAERADDGHLHAVEDEYFSPASVTLFDHELRKTGERMAQHEVQVAGEWWLR